MSYFCCGSWLQKLVGGLAVLMLAASTAVVVDEFDVGGVHVSGTEGVTVHQTDENEFEASGFTESEGTVQLLGENLTAIGVRAKLTNEHSTTLTARAGELSASTLVIKPEGNTVSFQPTFTGGDSEDRTYSVLGYDSDGKLIGALGRQPQSAPILVDHEPVITPIIWWWLDWWWRFDFGARTVGGECLWGINLPRGARWTVNDEQLEVSRLVFVEEIGDTSGQYTYLDFDGLEITTTADSLQIGQVISH